MKLVFADSHSIDVLTLARLMLVAEELTFVERPSIKFDEGFGTVGMPSNISSIASQFSDTPVQLKIEKPPNSAFSSDFYKEYFLKDFANPHFIDTVIDAIDKDFLTHWSTHPNENKNEGEYKDFKQWIVNNRNRLKDIDYTSIQRPLEVFKVTNDEEAIHSFKILLSEQSLRVTSVLTICEKINSNPVSINPFIDKLINLRLQNPIYTGKVTQSRQLGFRMLETFIPDEALSQLTFVDIIDFREKTKPYYEAWQIEINKLESRLLQNEIEISNRQVQYLIDQEINPRLFELKREIEKIRDDMFAKIIKVTKNMAISILAGGTLSGVSIPAAIAAFIVTCLKTKTPEITDEMINNHFQLKNIKKDNGLTYLLKINQLHT